MKTLALLIALLCLLGCGEDEEFPSDQFIGRWNIRTVRGKNLSSFFSPIISGANRVTWQYIFEADGSWYSTIEIRGDTLDHYGVNFFAETINLRGTYAIDDDYESDSLLTPTWGVILETTNRYSSSDSIKLSSLEPYIQFPATGYFGIDGAGPVIVFEAVLLRRAKN